MLVNMRETGVLRRMQATPVPAGALLSSYLIVNVVIGMLQAALILLTAVIFFNFNPSVVGILKAIPMIIAALLVSLALGQIVSGLAPKAGVAVALGQILYFSQMFISDMVMPVERMPEWLQSVAHYLPGYVIAQLVRPPLLLGDWGSAVGTNLLLVGGYTLVASLLAAFLFRWAPRS
jgi:ABC-2 type transport system permease protein